MVTEVLQVTLLSQAALSLAIMVVRDQLVSMVVLEMDKEAEILLQAVELVQMADSEETMETEDLVMVMVLALVETEDQAETVVSVLEEIEDLVETLAMEV